MICVLGKTPSFGFGDRLGNATAGHCLALQEFGGPLKGIFAQQSIREMVRTGRTPVQVLQDSERSLASLGYQGVRGADGDHLKTIRDVDTVMAAGFTFFTIDPSDYVDDEANHYSADEVIRRFEALKCKPLWISEYRGEKIELDIGQPIALDELNLMRCALKYGRAIEHSTQLGRYIVEQAEQEEREVEIELSIDETDQPTTPLEHWVFARQLKNAGLPLVSVAPRFFGNFEKGIDFFGDRTQFDQTLVAHASVARVLGGYKLSLHSGSDKISIYESFAKATRGLFHVKTAGTSYLEALRVTAVSDPCLFRRIVEYSRCQFEADRVSYHLSNGLLDASQPEALPDDEQLAR
ncbi:MAG: tagaturonate epimerase family protein, partial [Planctomycetota bacterium]|nr:tagaturonate epimerase family protein [Planctomycetota bacterium]